MFQGDDHLPLGDRTTFLYVYFGNLAVDPRRNVGEVGLNANIALVDMGEPIKDLVRKQQHGADQHDTDESFNPSL